MNLNPVEWAERNYPPCSDAAPSTLHLCNCKRRTSEAPPRRCLRCTTHHGGVPISLSLSASWHLLAPHVPQIPSHCLRCQRELSIELAIAAARAVDTAVDIL